MSPPGPSQRSRWGRGVAGRWPAYLPLDQKLMGSLSGQTVDSTLQARWPALMETCGAPSGPAAAPPQKPQAHSGTLWPPRPPWSGAGFTCAGVGPTALPLTSSQKQVFQVRDKTPSRLGPLLAEPPRWHRQWDRFLQSQVPWPKSLGCAPTILQSRPLFTPLTGAQVQVGAGGRSLTARGSACNSKACHQRA